jgi:hypothetical protein
MSDSRGIISPLFAVKRLLEGGKYRMELLFRLRLLERRRSMPRGRS